MIGRHSISGPLLMLVFAGWPTVASAADKPSQPAADFFEKEIRPLLADRCFKCHGGKKTRANLKLTSRAFILEGGDTGPAAVPGKPDESLFIQAVRHDGELKMPPNEKLNQQQIEKLTHWVRLGLPWPETSPEIATAAAKPAQSYQISDEQRRFWSFQPVKVMSPPLVQDQARSRSPIDRFILAKLQTRGLRPAQPADKRTLIRRATFDLTGLPPTPEEIDAFLADQSPDAFAKVVDRLLASPHYGERWGRHWLDVVRYTDSFDARILTGPGTIMDITEAYRYRDWVVKAFNQDLPYDQFIINQIAGDLLPPEEPGGVNVSGIVATGMLAIGNWGGGDADKEKLLTDIVDDQIDVVSRGFLALTVACARCHDHKFDPIPTEDYYSLAGIFMSSHILKDPGPKTDGPPMLRIPLLPQPEVQRREQIQAQIAGVEKQIKRAAAEQLALVGSLALRTNPYLAAAWEYQSRMQRHPSPHSAESAARIAKLKQELEKLKKTQVAPIPYANGIQEGGCPQSPQVGIHDVCVHIRGRYDRLGKPVSRRFPRIIAGDNQQPITEGSGRLQLARWIANAKNPLTAQVMVNRIWQHHFGEGLVRTPGNFGKLGQPPTHPELLDYLANRFVQAGWSIKEMHRAIMLSAANQQASVPAKETLAADPDNLLFGRMNRRRLEAEEIRDSLLAVSGQLDHAMGGRASQDFNVPRRTLYLMTIRSDRSSFRELFDAPDPTAIIDKRIASTVAPQALFLLNHPFALEEARLLAKRIVANGADGQGKIRRLYLLLYGRPPRQEEIKIGMALLAKVPIPESAAGKVSATEVAWKEYCQILMCANEFVYID